MVAPISFVMNLVFPKTTLPNRTFVSGVGPHVDLARNPLFDLAPTPGKIVVSFW
jgi:hypothetical protein